jgi:hypothetical protein
MMPALVERAQPLICFIISLLRTISPEQGF